MSGWNIKVWMKYYTTSVVTILGGPFYFRSRHQSKKCQKCQNGIVNIVIVFISRDLWRWREVSFLLNVKYCLHFFCNVHSALSPLQFLAMRCMSTHTYDNQSFTHVAYFCSILFQTVSKYRIIFLLRNSRTFCILGGFINP